MLSREGKLRDIWLFAEVDGGEVREIAFELASEGRKLADRLKERLCAVLFNDPEDFGTHLSQFGIDRIYGKRSSDGGDGDVQFFSQLILEYQPRLILIGATPLGREIAPRIAARTKVGVFTETVIFGLNDHGYFEATKMVLNDKVYSTIEIPASQIHLVTVVSGSFDLASPRPKRDIDLRIEKLEKGPSSRPVKFLEFLKGDPKKIDLSQAEIIVAAGKGVEEPELLKKIERLAELLGGSLGGSRVLVDKGWLPFERQVGLTGKTVSPKLFVCCGISGAFEFIAGMKDSKLIVAINNDHSAPIFKIANLSLEGDLRTIIPEILNQLGEFSEAGSQ